MAWNVRSTEEFRSWFRALGDEEKEDVVAEIDALKEMGPSLPFPHSTKIRGSRLSHLRELRIQHEGRPYRVLYAFDPTRTAVLLWAGEKTGDDRWYKRNVPIAEQLYQRHLAELRNEGLI